MKRFLHALAALWPERRGEGSPPLPDTRTGILQHGAAVLRMDKILSECVDLPIRKIGKETVGAGAPGELVRSDGGLNVSKREKGKSANTQIRESAIKPLLTIVILVFFMCLMAAKQVSAQAEPAAAAAAVPYKLPVVTREVISDPRHLGRIHQFTPDADLNRFPVKRYRVQADSTFKGLRIGDDIPEAVWQLPLWVVNGPDKMDTIALGVYRGSHLLVLDFWAKFCTPCVESMDKWESYMSELDGDVQLVGVQLDFDYKALPAIQEKGWQSPTVIGEGAYLLNRLFFQRDVISRMVWIRDGKLLAITSGRGYDIGTVKAVLAGLPADIAMDYSWTYPSDQLAID